MNIQGPGETLGTLWTEVKLVKIGEGEGRPRAVDEFGSGICWDTSWTIKSVIKDSKNKIVDISELVQTQWIGKIFTEILSILTLADS